MAPPDADARLRYSFFLLGTGVKDPPDRLFQLGAAGQNVLVESDAERKGTGTPAQVTLATGAFK